ncbi:MAG: putative DCC family thiol-disulfide oxidoreductase YuxK [Aureispira sp.]|jgi:predicted DCC family thiol-disulfide oxidoreductase YuxK
MIEPPAIVLFDGVCNFCNHSIQFIIKRDKKSYFKFGALQSEEGKALLKKHGLSSEILDTIVLIEGGKAYTYSTAPLRIVRKLSLLWPICFIFILVPTFIRNPIYKWISKNRYKWFGKQESCLMPTPEIRSRFL